MEKDIIGNINYFRSNPKYMKQLLDLALHLKEKWKIEDKMLLIVKPFLEKLEPLSKLENNNILSQITENKLSDFSKEGSKIDKIIKKSLPKEFKNPQVIVIKSKEKISGSIEIMLLDNLDKFKNRAEILFNPKLNQIGIAKEIVKKDGEDNKFILLFANKGEAKKENESNSFKIMKQKKEKIHQIMKLKMK